MKELIVAFRNYFEIGRKNVSFIFPSFFVCTCVVFNVRAMGPIVTKIGYRWPSNVLSPFIIIGKRKMADLRS